jgi:hypothetical protein
VFESATGVRSSAESVESLSRGRDGDNNDDDDCDSAEGADHGSSLLPVISSAAVEDAFIMGSIMNKTEFLVVVVNVGQTLLRWMVTIGT